MNFERNGDHMCLQASVYIQPTYTGMCELNPRNVCVCMTSTQSWDDSGNSEGFFLGAAVLGSAYRAVTHIAVCQNLYLTMVFHLGLSDQTGLWMVQHSYGQN